MYKKMQSIKRLIDKKLFEVAEKEIIIICKDCKLKYILEYLKNNEINKTNIIYVYNDVITDLYYYNYITTTEANSL